MRLWPGLHVAAGHAGSVVSPDHAAEHVHGRVRAHELVAAFPVQLAMDRVADNNRGFAAVGCQPVPDLAAVTLHLGHSKALAVDAQPTRIIGLTTAARIEGRAIQHDTQLAVGHIDIGHMSVKLVEICIFVIEQFGHELVPLVTRDWDGELGSVYDDIFRQIPITNP